MEKDFRDLEIWQEAHRLVLGIYKISNHFPREELHGLISQIRRSSVSVELNIAEGYGRHHYGDEIKFLINSRASVSETQSALLIAKDLGYITVSKTDELFEAYKILAKRINSLIAYKRKKK